jgi:Zn-dependent protease
MMLGKRFALFRVSGISVRIDPSWLIIAGLITWSLAEGLFPQRFTELDGTTHWSMAAAGAFGLFVSIIVHELAHGVAALQLGIPMHGITLFLFGGVAEMGEEPKTPKAELWMAAAGPIASLLLAILFLPLALDAEIAHRYVAVAGIAEYLTVMNVLLAAFNLLPAFPLDGGRMLRAALWWGTNDFVRATKIATTAGRIFGVGFVALGFLELLQWELIAGAWWILIGLFLRSSAKRALEHCLAQSPAIEPTESWQKDTTATPSPTLLSRSRHTAPNLAS